MGQSSSSSAGNRHHRPRNEYYYPTHSPNPNYPPPPGPPPQPFHPNATSQQSSHPLTSPLPPPSYQAMSYLTPPMYNYYVPQPNHRYYPLPPQSEGSWHSYVPPYPTIRLPVEQVSGGSWGMGSAAVQVPHVEHEVTKTIKNDVNVHKDTITLKIDEENPDRYLVEFTFDANFDGRYGFNDAALTFFSCLFSTCFFLSLIFILHLRQVCNITKHMTNQIYFLQ